MDRKCKKFVTTPNGNFFFHYLFGKSFPQINQKLVYLLLISDERCITTENIGCTAQNSTMARTSQFCSKNSEGLFPSN